MGSRSERVVSKGLCDTTTMSREVPEEERSSKESREPSAGRRSNKDSPKAKKKLYTNWDECSHRSNQWLYQ